MVLTRSAKKRAAKSPLQASSRSALVVAFLVLLHYAIVLAVLTAAHDLLFGSPSSAVAPASAPVSVVFTLSYFTALVLLRLTTASDPRPATYELAWACNTTLLLVPFTFYVNRPQLATASALAVSIDQLLWYVDLAGWLTMGKVSMMGEGGWG